jgi:hypothetical protein
MMRVFVLGLLVACSSKREPNRHCPAVAEALTSIEIGNYAPHDVRAVKVKEMAEKCEAANPSQNDAACIVEAQTKDALAYCPKPIIVAAEPRDPASGAPSVCADYLRSYQKYIDCLDVPADQRKVLESTLEQLKAGWKTRIDSGTNPAQIANECRGMERSMQSALQQMGCKPL